LRRDAKSLLKKALRHALERLPARERMMTLQHYVDGVGVVPLGKLFGVAPSTVSRTLARARVQLLAEIQRALHNEHRLDRVEVDRLVDLVASQLTLSTGALPTDE